MKDSRRKFIRTITAGGITGIVFPGMLAGKSLKKAATTHSEIEPSAIQRAWMELKFGMFIHFGINTYYDREWSDGTLDISVFNPENIDTDEWCSVAQQAGMRYIVIGAKHHDGFCLWRSKYTGYSVKNTPFKKDIIEMVSRSARKYGLKLGLYYSLWDRNNTLHDTDEYGYVQFMKEQFNELLTQYGPVTELWLDGFWKKQQTGWKDKEGNFSSPDDFINSWRNEGVFRWQIDHLYQYIKQIQPECLVMNNATSKYPGVPLHPVDATCGERALTVKKYRKTWFWLGKERYFPMQLETTMSTKGNEQFPQGNWFWHEWDHSVATHKQIAQWLSAAEKMDANLLLNCGPMANGRLRPEDIKVLTTFRS